MNADTVLPIGTREPAGGVSTSRRYDPPGSLLTHHGDRDVDPALIDLAVNVRRGGPPPSLARRLSSADLAAYPDQHSARLAVAARHHREPAEVLLTAGAAESFVLVARALRPRTAVVVHPQFTEPEVALRAAGHAVERVVLDAPFTLEPGQIPDRADLVVIGNPTNPTSVLHPADALRALARPGRVLVVDEAFMDCVPGERESLAGASDIAGLVVIRSLTKTWGLAGLRAGYLLAEPSMVGRLAAAQPAWPVSTPALLACEVCSHPDAVAEAQRWAVDLAAARARLCMRLDDCDGVTVAAQPDASFVLLQTRAAGLWRPLRGTGYSTRRGDTFPGLGSHHLRIAVREPSVMATFVDTLTTITTASRAVGEDTP